MRVNRGISGGPREGPPRWQLREVHPILEVRFRETEVEHVELVLVVEGARTTAHHEVVRLDVSVDVARIMHLFYPMKLYMIY